MIQTKDCEHLRNYHGEEVNGYEKMGMRENNRICGGGDVSVWHRCL
jgi:hypothetical protein